MNTSQNLNALATRIEQLIDLLQQMLARDAHPLADRMDKFLTEISRIDRSMSRAAHAMEMTAPQISDMPTRQDLYQFEDRMVSVLENMSRRHAILEQQMQDLLQPLGHEEDG